LSIIDWLNGISSLRASTNEPAKLLIALVSEAPM